MATGVGLRQVGYFDCAGGGQVVVVDGIAYIGHMRSPHGTSIVDVSDPRNCRGLASIGMPAGTHSHKVRVGNGLMLVNHELNGADPRPPPAEFAGGIGIYDVADPAKPRRLTHWTTVGKGVHRFDFDGRYAYASPTLDGYVGTIMLILDLAEPQAPQEAGRWWLPGQWTAGGEVPSWQGDAYRVLTPEQTLALASDLGSHSVFYLNPLLAGIDPAFSWRMLRLYERAVHPYLKR